MALQAGALVAVVALRCTAPGWFLFIAIMTIAGPLLALVPTVLALGVLRRRVLPARLTAPFVACAGLLVFAGATMPDFDDVRDHAPVLVLLGHGDTPVPEALYGLGMLGVAGWLVALLWLVVALVVARRPARRTVGPPHPAWLRRPDAE